MADTLTEDQRNEYREAFALFDLDRDGFITARELENILRATG